MVMFKYPTQAPRLTTALLHPHCVSMLPDLTLHVFVTLGSESRSRLRGMQTLRLSGLDISDSTLRLLLRHMPLLQRLDLAHCRAITDQSINLLTSTGSPTRHTLTELNLAGTPASHSQALSESVIQGMCVCE